MKGEDVQAIVKGEDVCAVIVFVIQIVLVVDNIPIEIVLVIGIIVDFRLFIIILVIMFIEIIFAFGRGESLGRIRVALIYFCSVGH